MLAAVGVTRVISVDDEYRERVPEWGDIAERVRARPDVVAARWVDANLDTFDGGQLAWSSVVHTRFDAADGDTKLAFARELGLKTTEIGVRAPGMVLEAVATLFAGLPGIRFDQYSLAEFSDQEAALIETAGSPVMLLFDQNFTAEGQSRTAGLSRLEELKEHQHLLLAMLVNDPEATEGSLQVDPLALERIIVIGKTLVSEPMAFVRKVRTTLFTQLVADLKRTAISVIVQAYESAAADVEARINLDVFENVVFRLSWEEGVWEADTLFRLYGLYARRASLHATRANADLQRLTATIRQLSAVDVKDEPAAGAWDVQHDEMYEDPGALNGLYLPLELGDIFEFPGVPGKRWILVAQPCDLMIRRKGERSGLGFVDLLQVRTTYPGEQPHHKLPFLEVGPHQDGFASLSRPLVVPLEVLDLCALNGEGSAVLDLGVTHAPELAIGPLVRRREVLVRAYENALRVWGKATILNAHERARLLPGGLCAGLPKARVTDEVTGRKVAFSIKRTGRLRMEWAKALLISYHQHEARLAFEMEFERRTGNEPTSGEADQSKRRSC
jgi:hypothetical protein